MAIAQTRCAAFSHAGQGLSFQQQPVIGNSHRRQARQRFFPDCTNDNTAMSEFTDNSRPYIDYTKAFNRQMANAMNSRQADVLVLTPQEYVGILQDKVRRDPRLAERLHGILAQSALGRYWRQTVSPGAEKPVTLPAALAATDSYLIAKTLIALGIAGAGTYIKTTAKGSYIIIKGRAGFRHQLLQGTRFLATHPRMIQMGLGMRGLQNVARGGFILSIVVSTAVETLDFIFNDGKTMHDLVGGIGVEAVKAGLATSIGLIAGFMAPIVTAVAVAPLFTMAVVVFVSGIALNMMDRKFKIKERVIASLKSIPAGTDVGLYLLKSDDCKPLVASDLNLNMVSYGIN
jgi:hypothetical protein